MAVLFDWRWNSLKIFDKFKNFFNSANVENDVPAAENTSEIKTYLMSKIMDLFSGRGGGGEYGQDLSEVTYMTCLKVLSESLSKIPVYLIDNDKNRVTDNELSYILSVKPNPYQTPSQFFGYLEFCRNHKGNAFSYVNRSPNGKVEGLYPLNPSSVQVELSYLSCLSYFAFKILFDLVVFISSSAL